MKLCKDCIAYDYCVFNGYTTEDNAQACKLYECVWWKFWRPS